MSYVETVYWLFILPLILYNVGAQLLHFCNTDGKDPCVVANEKLPFEPEARYVNCGPTSSPYCDRYITPGWYRYDGRMWDQCPELASCGAVYPSWLNGSHPTEVNTEVEGSVCKVGFGSCCTSRVTIKIRNCGQFMAYCLPALDTCPERYCFGESGPCAISTSEMTTTPVTATKTTQADSSQSTTTYLKTTDSVLPPSATSNTTYPREDKAGADTATNFTSSSSTKATELLKTAETAPNEESSTSTIIVALAITIGILVFLIGLGIIVFFRKCRRNESTNDSTYDKPFSPLAEAAYEMPLNTYINDEGGYEQLPVDQNGNSGYTPQPDDPYATIDERIQRRQTRIEEITREG